MPGPEEPDGEQVQVLRPRPKLRDVSTEQTSINASMMSLHDEQARMMRNLETRLTKVEEQLQLATAGIALTSMQVDSSQGPSASVLNIQQVKPDAIDALDATDSDREEETGGKEELAGDDGESACDDEEPGNVYNFTVSMWDAAMLLGFHRVHLMDKLIILLGVVLNWGLQLLLLLVVSLDMLDNDFTDERVRDLMTWRVEKGHAHAEVDKRTGSTLVERLCNQTLWSYEQEEYNHMHEYLYQKMPGWSLTVLAITLWVLTITVEFRGVCEQGMAMLQLPRLDDGQQGLVKSEDGFQVVGMRRSRKIGAFLFLVLPRLTITISLAFVGCHYLALTLSLHDIVLNSLALAFVMEVDELIAEVLLPRKLKTTVESMKPIESGKPYKIGDCHMPDLIRYVLSSGLIIFACLYWLLPFHGNVEAAAMALCAGNLGFSQTGGTTDLPTIVLLNTQNFISTCSDAHFVSSYLPNSYPDYLQSQSNGSGEKKSLSGRVSSHNQTAADLEDRRLKATLKYAFSGCPSGQIKGLENTCTAASFHFQHNFRNLTEGVEAGGSSGLPQCKVFDPKLGAATCSSSNPADACLWNWEGYQCEQDPPGFLQKSACPADFTEKETITESCQIWEDMFGKPHPSANCLFRNYCPESEKANCVNLIGQLALTIGNSSAYQVNESATQAAISGGLSTMLGVSSNTVTILQIRGWSVNWDAVENLVRPSPPGHRRLTAESLLDSFWADAEPIVSNSSGTSLVKFLVSSLPVTLLPDSIPGRTAMLAVQMDNELGKGTVTSVQLTPWPPWFGNDDHVRAALEPHWLQYMADNSKKPPGGGGGGKR